ncbi:MAG TPA: hypothetical protein DDX89_07260 [Candidatus Omnitrophica bacterium]|nr:hypothetical protein [Candidatus Omnitrophota bacterium]
MANRTRRYETGKMLMDVAKYFATVTGVGSLASPAVNWVLVVLGLMMAFVCWGLGFIAIPQDVKE